MQIDAGGELPALQRVDARDRLVAEHRVDRGLQLRRGAEHHRIADGGDRRRRDPRRRDGAAVVAGRAVVEGTVAPGAVLTVSPGRRTIDAWSPNPPGVAALPPLPSPMTTTASPTTIATVTRPNRAASWRWVSAGAARNCAKRRSSAPWRIGSSTYLYDSCRRRKRQREAEDEQREPGERHVGMGPGHHVDRPVPQVDAVRTDPDPAEHREAEQPRHQARRRVHRRRDEQRRHHRGHEEAAAVQPGVELTHVEEHPEQHDAAERSPTTSSTTPALRPVLPTRRHGAHTNASADPSSSADDARVGAVVHARRITCTGGTGRPSRSSTRRHRSARRRRAARRVLPHTVRTSTRISGQKT